jgi:hypothetical protein
VQCVKPIAVALQLKNGLAQLVPIGGDGSIVGWHLIGHSEIAPVCSGIAVRLHILQFMEPGKGTRLFSLLSGTCQHRVLRRSALAATFATTTVDG